MFSNRREKFKCRNFLTILDERNYFAHRPKSGLTYTCLLFDGDRKNPERPTWSP